MNWSIELRATPPEDLRAEIEALAVGYEPAWYTTLNADRDRPAWFLARNEGIIGFLTVFDPSGEAAEVSAFVAPEYRRQGVFRSLLQEARRIWEAPERRWLLVAERRGVGSVVARRLGRLSFTESTLSLAAADRPPMQGLPDGLLLTEGLADDLDSAASVLDPGSGEPRAFLERVFAESSRRFLVLKENDEVVGVGCLHEEGEQTNVHAVAIRPDRQGRGWGRALVSALLALARGRELVLEVDSTNARAERLYRSLGFRDQQVTDYYELP